MESPKRGLPASAATFYLLVAAILSGCQKLPRVDQPNRPDTSGPSNSGSAPSRPPMPVRYQRPTGYQVNSSDLKPFDKLDAIRTRFPNYMWWEAPDNPELNAAFEPVRELEAWKAFVDALRAGDNAVNILLEENITDWSDTAQKINPINKARNAWRKACTYGIRPPELPRGSTSFTEQGMEFRLYVSSSSDGVLVVRSKRDQVLGIFELELAGGGGQHIVSHMLENAIRYPDIYLSYPWDIVMVTDTIFIPDVHVWIDRIEGKATLTSPGTAKPVVRSDTR